MTNQELKELILDVVSEIEKGDPTVMKAQIQRFRDAGIEADCHVGKREPFTERETLEWYAGQGIDLVNREAWHCVNGWINWSARIER